MMVRFLVVTALATLSALPAAAHTGVHADFSLAHGLLHPLFGLDHAAAMVAVGLMAATAAADRVWLWPASFVLAMVGGAGLTRVGFDIPYSEQLTVASVIGLGLCVALGVRLPATFGAALVALFALAHGSAHAAEAPANGFLAYVGGFVLTTAVLHACGVVIARVCASSNVALVVRAIGAAMATLGVALAWV